MNKFQNLTQSNMDFEDVFACIENFMRLDPRGEYRLMIGTDSHVHKRETWFITGIAIQRMGKGVWACYTKTIVPRKMSNLRERMSMETSLTEEVAYHLTPEMRDRLVDIVLPHIYKGASLSLQGHLDMGYGKRNKTAQFIEEMVARLEAIGLEAVIKPDSIIASGYANHLTK
jgi:predicted RNase H-related nuclease YkuK (DUF458 family)